ncbi:MAG: aliphatic sulfonate ABC transporter substrate-binding protein [Phenylobacterium zucineum]|nr:MAG: aliphatic sulfonate ABC transporter substrate-binding protein [Phenylobacterium zucineum]
MSGSDEPIRPFWRPVPRGLHRRALLGVGVGAALSGCARGADGPVLKVGSQRGGAKALTLASGVLDGAPYRIEWSEFAAAQPLLEAIGAGAVDVGAAGDAPFLFAFAGGAKVRAIHAARSAAGGASTALLTPAGSRITTLADLAGARIATGRGSIGHYLVLGLLDRAGLKTSDVTLNFLSPGDSKAAFTTGAVDAWATWGSYVSLAVRDDRARVLADGRGILSGYGFNVSGLRSIETKRAELADFLARYSRAQRWIGDHQGAYAAVLSRETGLDLDIAAQTVASVRGEPVPIDEAVIAEETRVLRRFQAAGVIATAPDLRAGFDTSFNDAVRA